MLATLTAAMGSAWSWIVLGLVLMGGELLAPGVFLVWLGLAALATGIVDSVFDLSWQGESLTFAVLAVIIVLLAKRITTPAVHGLNRGAARLVGREFLLDAPIADGVGRARLDDSVWRLRGADAPAGTRMRVTAVDGSTLLVGPA